MNYQENWVSINEILASMVGYATSLYQALDKVPKWFAEGGNAEFWKQLTEATGRLGLNSTPDGLVTDRAGIDQGEQTKKLRAALQNYANVTARCVRRRTSPLPCGVTRPRLQPSRQKRPPDAYDRATESIESILHVSRPIRVRLALALLLRHSFARKPRSPRPPCKRMVK